MKEEYHKFGSQMNPIHFSAIVHAQFNGDFFCKETELTKWKPDPSNVDSFPFS